MVIVDAHQDIAFNTLCFGRDYRLSALKKRADEAHSALPHPNGRAMLGLPEALAGRVAVIFATLFTEPRGKLAPLGDAVSYTTPKEAMQSAQKQLDVYQRLADEDPPYPPCSYPVRFTHRPCHMGG